MAEVKRKGERVFLGIGNFEFEVVVSSTPEHTAEMLERLVAEDISPLALRLLADALIVVHSWIGLKEADMEAVAKGLAEPQPGIPQGRPRLADRVHAEIEQILQDHKFDSGSTSDPTSA